MKELMIIHRLNRSKTSNNEENLPYTYKISTSNTS